MQDFEDIFDDDGLESIRKFQNWQESMFDLGGFGVNGVEISPEKIEIFDQYTPGLLHLRKKSC